MKRILKAFTHTSIVAVAILVAASLLWEQPIVLAIVIFLLGLLIIVISKTIKEDMFLYLYAGIAGALAEVVAIAFGAWTYGLSNFWGIPYWLPFAWGAAALTIKNANKEIHSFIKEKHL